MIASLGGAIVNSDGSRSYPASGGFIGGLSLDGGNWAYFTGAGKSYEKFVQPVFNSAIDMPDTSDYPRIETGGGGGGGGGGGTVTTLPTSGTYGLPSWIPQTGTYSGAHPLGTGQITFNFGTNGTVIATHPSGAQFSGQFYQVNGDWFLRIGNDIARVIRTAFGFVTESGGQSISYYGSNIDTQDTPPVFNCLWGNCDGTNPTDIPVLPRGILDELSGLLAPSPKTSVDIPPNLFSVNPNQSSGSGVNMKNMVLIGVVGVIAYFVWKKYF